MWGNYVHGSSARGLVYAPYYLYPYSGGHVFMAMLEEQLSHGHARRAMERLLTCDVCPAPWACAQLWAWCFPCPGVGSTLVIAVATAAPLPPCRLTQILYSLNEGRLN